MEKSNRYSVEYEWGKVIYYQDVEAMTIQEAKERIQNTKVNAAIRAIHVIEDVES
ncbi:hypothetical protein IUJ58_22985 [Priestia aryabhattai]|uniref:hypothetical protein n=1 Tax=Priestia aryabhattai TaxID=412384 RepID=UPI001C0DA2A3|nr:hypothetical protein [Priestia aryabhattai]MBU3573814.1 hypothetical protein [Priestia aryabhattai]WDL86782.1 hypothetical protein IUJ58_22985 [Priestia aryabhattai]